VVRYRWRGNEVWISLRGLEVEAEWEMGFPALVRMGIVSIENGGTFDRDHLKPIYPCSPVKRKVNGQQLMVGAYSEIRILHVEVNMGNNYKILKGFQLFWCRTTDRNIWRTRKTFALEVCLVGINGIHRYPFFGVFKRKVRSMSRVL
jgi:hypothetical protein